MEAIALLLTKFADELIAAQLAGVSASFALALYWLLIRKKKRETAEWVPAALVRAYLDRMRADERDTRIRLFGDDFSALPPMTMPTGIVAGPVASADPQMGRELEAMRAQLALADQRAIEFDRNLNALKLEKGALEQKLKDALSAAPAGSAVAGDQGALLKELEDYKAKLKEYEVIEDDLANLKKFQKENAELKQKVSQLESGAANSTSISGTPAAPTAETKVSGVTDHINTPVTVISGGKAGAAPAPSAPAAATASAAPAAASAEANTNVLQAVTPTVSGNPTPVAAAEENKSPKQKEEELLSEFEKMLAS